MRRMKSESLIYKERNENGYIESVVELNISLYTKILIVPSIVGIYYNDIVEFKVRGNGLYTIDYMSLSLFYEDGICSLEIDKTLEGVLEVEIYGVK